MTYSRINNLTGWGMFLIALVVYLLTMAPTASYWDCGEFIACANELEVPHPPGAPFFLLLGRIFAMLAFGNVGSVAFMLNLMSVLSASFTVLFTFWITTHLAKKMMVGMEGKPTSPQTIAIMGAGLVAGLANTFADSFWFNAVEAEVYALSSFFTAIVVWLGFKWESRADEPGNERWLILIAYLMGLSIGVHLLNLLAIPAIAFIFYFRKYDFNWRGFIITGAISVAILGVIQTGIILNSFDVAWAFEKVLVGTIEPDGDTTGMGLPIGTGLILFFILLFSAIVGGIWYSVKTKNLALNTVLMGLTVIYIGFSSYMMIPIRSQANPPIDENNPEDSRSFISYMKREQYGDRPLLKGPLYNAQPIALEETGTEYVLEKGNDRYTELGPKRKYKYADRDQKLFPRMYDAARPASWSPDYGPWTYSNFVKRKGDPKVPSDDKPTGGEDLSFFWNYQVVHMYWRYFMWNFAGREGDTQDMSWESGLNFGFNSKMPDFIKDAPAKNHFFLIPFLLGMLGLFWQSSKRGEDAAVVGLLFFFTGLAIIIYLNQYPNQPRERDYSFAGSFQTFAIWVGLGTIALYELLEKYLKGAAAYVASGLALVGPLLMGAQGWDDHSRAGRYIAPESAYNLLNSCAKNAVLFTNGDNDTFPLWYLQEVEGIRTDVRVLCLSYVNTDWYIDQMKEQMNESPALPITLPRKDYVGQAKQSRAFGNRNTFTVSLPAEADDLLSQGIIYEEDLSFVESPMQWKVPTRGGQGRKYLELKDILILNLVENVARDGWERPIYFANTVTPSSFLNLDDYLRLEGLAYRILPVKRPKANDPYDPFDGTLDLERMYNNMVGTFKYTNLNIPGVYYDENVMRMLSNYHNTFYRLANGYLREVDRMGREDAELRKQIEAGSINVDSAQAVIAANRTRSDELRAKGVEVMNFTEEKFPYHVATPDPYMIVRAGIMYERLGQSEKALEYYAFAQERVLKTLKYYSDIDRPFYRTREYVYPIRLLQRQYAQGGFQEQLQSLEEGLQSIDPQMLNLR